jgi:hypothetical protein
VKLEITIMWNEWEIVAEEFEYGNQFPEEKKSDPYAATRRAIVRAAAEIGKGMK